MGVSVNMRSESVNHGKNSRCDTELFVEIVFDDFCSLLENDIENSIVTVLEPKISEFFR